MVGAYLKPTEQISVEGRKSRAQKRRLITMDLRRALNKDGEQNPSSLIEEIVRCSSYVSVDLNRTLLFLFHNLKICHTHHIQQYLLLYGGLNIKYIPRHIACFGNYWKDRKYILIPCCLLIVPCHHSSQSMIYSHIYDPKGLTLLVPQVS